MIEVFSEAMDGDDHPIGVAAVTEFDRWIRIVPNSLLRQTDATLREAGQFRWRTVCNSIGQWCLLLGLFVLKEFLIAVPDGNIAHIRQFGHLALSELLVYKEPHCVEGCRGRTDGAIGAV